MRRTLPLSLVQTSARSGGLDEFAADLEQRTRDAPDTDLFVYPELHLCGAAEQDESAAVAATAEPLDGPRDRALAELAGDLGIWLAPGSTYERGRDGNVHNTAAVYSPGGQRVAEYRKIFPWRPHEKTAPGTRFAVFDMGDLGRVGLSICYDAWFPEHARHLAWMGAELVLNVVRTPTRDRPQEAVLARANAITNQVFVASVNAAAPDGLGRSLLVDPEGTVLAEAPHDRETALHANVDLADATAVRARGTAGLNRVWHQFRPDDEPLPLPLYDGTITPNTWSADRANAPGTAGSS